MKRIVFFVVLSAAAAAGQQTQSVHERAADLQRSTLLVDQPESAEMKARKEAALGKSLVSEMQLHYETVTDPGVVAYINGLARQVADVRVTTMVFKSDEVRAGTFPGGYVFVSTGLIARMTGEAELAGVLAHEIAHAAARDSLRPVKVMSSSEASIPLIFFGGWSGICSKYGGELLVPRALQAPMREREQEADQRAAEYLKNMSTISDSTRFEEIQRLSMPAPREFRRPSLRRPNG